MLRLISTVLFIQCLLCQFKNIYTLSPKGVMRKLLANYDPACRPVQHGSESVKASIRIALQQVMDLDEKNQVLLTSLLIQLKWNDAVLGQAARNLCSVSVSKQNDFNSSRSAVKGDKMKTGKDKVPSTEDTTCIILPADRIWTPDLYVYNNAADGENGLMYVNESRIRVGQNGDATWNLPVTVQSSCTVNVLYFPFDHQICDIQLASWTYDHTQLELYLVNEEKRTTLSGIIENAELAIPEAKFIHQYRRGLDGRNYSQVVVRIHIQRRALFYGYTVIAPSLLLCVLTMFSFCLPSGNARKINIGLTVYLFLYFLQVLIAENTPESNAPPLIGTFLTVVMTLNSLSLMCATSVLYLHGQSENKTCRNPPLLLWNCATKCLSKLTFLSHDTEKEALYACVSRTNTAPNVCPSGKSNVSRIRTFRWMYVARVMDRVLFLIYFLATAVLVFLFLVYFPSSSEIKL